MAEGPTPWSSGFVSTGHLPGSDRVRLLVAEAHRRCAPVADGAVSDVYPTLARARPDLLGVCVASADGAIFATGDAAVAFAVMSVIKPFTFALLCERIGAARARAAIGVNATGLPFNSVEAVERVPAGRTNPMVNPGAIATVAKWIESTGDPWVDLVAGLAAFAGHPLPLDEETYRCASETNRQNRALVHLLHAKGALAGDADEALDLYTRQCCLSVTAEDLAVMGATLAHGGVNPRTGERVVGVETCRCTLAVMATAGMYETSGDWLYDVGLPGKSGIGGGIVTVSPGKGALGTFSPRLDAAGNSVRGQMVAAFLARSLGLDIFTSSDD